MFLPTVVVALILGAVISVTFTDDYTGETSGAGSFLLVLLIGGAYFVAPAIYFGTMNGGQSGQTVGKKIVGIQVRDVNTGGEIGVGRGLLRYVVPTAASMVSCGLFGLLDALWPLWDQRRQAIHDKIASSVVIQKV